MKTYTISTRRLGFSRVEVDGKHYPLNAPVVIDDESVLERIKALDGVEVAETGAELEDLTVDELKDKARDAGVEGFSKMKKDELLTALQKDAVVPSEATSNDTTDAEGDDPGYAGGDAAPAPPATT